MTDLFVFSLATVLTTIASIGGLLLVRRLVTVEKMRMNHDVADPLLSVVGTLFAVLLGFMVANAMQRFEEARLTAQQEASAVANVFRAADGFPDGPRKRIQHACESYVDQVIKIEWPALAEKKTSEVAWESYDQIWKECVHFIPENDGQSNIQQGLMEYLGEMGNSRRMRVGALHNGLPKELWVVLLAGGAATICFTYFFGVENTRLQVLMTALVSLAICLNLFLLACFDDPFSGDVMVRPTAFETVRSNFNALEHPGNTFVENVR